MFPDVLWWQPLTFLNFSDTQATEVRVIAKNYGGMWNFLEGFNGQV